MESNKKSFYKSLTWPAVHIGFVGTMVYFLKKLLLEKHTGNTLDFSQ